MWQGSIPSCFGEAGGGIGPKWAREGAKEGAREVAASLPPSNHGEGSYGAELSSGQRQGPATAAAVAPPPPIPSRAFPHRGFESVGGSVGGAVQTLKEMVLLPLLYPELLAGMGTSPPG